MEGRGSDTVLGEPLFGILGPLTLSNEAGRPVDIGGRKQRELLAALLLDANRVISHARLVDALWAGGPPASVEVTLRAHVSRLRSRLAEAGAENALVSRPGGYGLFLKPEQIDARRFEKLLSDGQQALRHNDPDGAADLLASALRSWRGEVLQDLHHPDFAAAEAARLSELRLVAIELRIQADLMLGGHAAVIPELERLIVDHPFRETLHRQLMLALYQSGRQVQALAVGTEIRRRLADELGVDPGPELRDLESAILHHDPSLRPGASTTRDATVSLPPVTPTKYRPPAAPRTPVARDRLIDALRAGGHRRLFLIHGPAGFGKTTLAAQWRETLLAQGETVAWFTIDGDDDNVVWFLAHLIDAVGGVRALSEELRGAVNDHDADAQRRVLASLINELEHSGSPFWLVIDDWHRVTDAATIAALTYLLHHGGEHLRVVVTSRSRAHLPLGRMRVSDQLVEIDTAALRFDQSEARRFLLHARGLSLNDADVATLGATTEGWIAALQLVSLSLRENSDPATLIQSLSGHHSGLGEYLAENVLDSLESSMLDFLMATSLPERVTGDLACALAGVTNGQAMLEEVENRDLFLRRLDDERGWFQYHQLFADFLQRRLECGDPDRITQLHAKASRWFADHHMLHEAISHAVSAGDEDRAIELIEHQSIEFEQRAQLPMLQTLVAGLPPRIVTPSPRLQLFLARANSLLQQPAAARAALDAFDAALQALTLPESESRAMRIEADVFRALVEVWADHGAGVEELLDPCLSDPDSVSPFVVATAANIASFVATCRFDFTAARRWQDWADVYHRRSGTSFVLIYGHCLAAMASNQELDAVETQRRLREAVRLAKTSGAPTSHAARVAYALSAEFLYERDQVDEAERLLEESGGFGTPGGPPVEFMIARCVTGARIKMLRGQHDAAAEILDGAANVAATADLPRLSAAVATERIRLGLPTPRHPIRQATDRGILHDVTAQLRDECATLALLDDDPDLACRRAEGWVNRLAAHHRPRALLNANRLFAAALAAAGRADEASHVLACVAAQCAERDMVRFLLDGGPHLVALLPGLRNHPGVRQDFLEQVLSAAT
ncbi:BTAD domain-containing putative transcriptional regulator [Mycobacterium sp. SMC-4]|uniref:BTAD domain-containing putative transcriptional regulator n=1 Tax=Mycobacterium sp. SMC-4 TaxID=2857059 RepID=UPI0021B1C558|nr:BTAD domain-containing putative transcriptional regulator [Mycobacterium sp. SMC-4]UXA17513.1 AAA family ATPase [Mycobacterium sp. SMC-4]